jgi:hypothetical protein
LAVTLQGSDCLQQRKARHVRWNKANPSAPNGLKSPLS